MVIVDKETPYTKYNGKIHYGYFMDDNTKPNIDNHVIRAIKKKFDACLLFTGMEGSGKTTLASLICRYCDPEFPGPLRNDGTQRRHCDRIVFNAQQIMKAIDTAKIGQAILIDEAVLSMASQDAGSEIQKVLIKKFVTIRKKRLIICIVIPSIFMLRKYFAIFRTRALFHCILPDGISRGLFKFYNYVTKRRLYIKGIKEYNQNAVKEDFVGHFSNTENFFYCPIEYDKKKEEAIKELSTEKNKKKEPASLQYKILKSDFAVYLYKTYNALAVSKGGMTSKDFSKYLEEHHRIKMSAIKIAKLIAEGKKISDWCIMNAQYSEDFVRTETGFIKKEKLKDKIGEQ